jgi:hypothetical protein
MPVVFRYKGIRFLFFSNDRAVLRTPEQGGATSN